MAWQLNEALSLAFLASEVSLYTPLAPPANHSQLPGLQWDPERLFHTSAICAAALDNVTYPFRCTHTPSTPSSGVEVEKLLLFGGMMMLELAQRLCASPLANLAALHGQMPMPPVPPAPGSENDARARPQTPGEHIHPVASVLVRLLLRCILAGL